MCVRCVDVRRVQVLYTGYHGNDANMSACVPFQYMRLFPSIYTLNPSTCMHINSAHNWAKRARAMMLCHRAIAVGARWPEFKRSCEKSRAGTNRQHRKIVWLPTNRRGVDSCATPVWTLLQWSGTLLVVQRVQHALLLALCSLS